MAQRISFSVAPMSKADIESVAFNYLNLICPRHLKKPGQLNVERILDIDIYRTHGFTKLINDSLDEDIEALTNHFAKVVEIKSSVQLGIINDEPHYRFTACHEAFHVIQHSPQILSWNTQDYLEALSLPRGECPIYRDPEWQANCGAGALLMPAKTLYSLFFTLKNKNANDISIISEVAKIYNVSNQAAETRLVKLDLIQKQKTPERQLRGFNK